MKNKSLKTGILVATLVLPVCFFVGAHFLGENQFGLPRFGALGIKNEIKHGFVFEDSVYHQVGDYSFLDQDSVSFSIKNWKNKIKVVSVFSAKDKTEYAQIISNITRLSAVYQNQESVGILTIAVNSEKDSPKTLKDYKKLYEIENEYWKFLKASDVLSLNKYLQNEVYLASKENFSMLGNVFKSQTIVLIDKSDVIRGYYDGTRLEDVDDLIGAIKILQTEYE